MDFKRKTSVLLVPLENSAVISHAIGFFPVSKVGSTIWFGDPTQEEINKYLLKDIVFDGNFFKKMLNHIRARLTGETQKNEQKLEKEFNTAYEMKKFAKHGVGFDTYNFLHCTLAARTFFGSGKEKILIEARKLF